MPILGFEWKTCEFVEIIEIVDSRKTSLKAVKSNVRKMNKIHNVFRSKVWRKFENHRKKLKSLFRWF